MSDESIKSPSAPKNFLDLSLDYYGSKIRVEFNKNCLNQDKITYNHGKIVNIYTVYETNKNYNISSYPTLENCLFGVVTLTKNVDIDQNEYSGYAIGFDRKRLHYNGANSYLFAYVTEIVKFKARDSEIVRTLLCLGDVWKYFSVDNMKKSGLNGYVYDFSVDSDAIAVDDILDIHKYLMKKMI